MSAEESEIQSLRSSRENSINMKLDEDKKLFSRVNSTGSIFSQSSECKETQTMTSNVEDMEDLEIEVESSSHIKIP